MKATFRSRYGGPEVLSVKELKMPALRPHELLVSVHTTTVNRTDCGVLRGSPFIFRFFTGLFRPRYASTGTDFAGVVEAVGHKVSRFKAGDRVFGFNDTGWGSHSAYFTVPENGPVTHIPDSISFETAAASAEGAHYAWNYIRKTGMKAGDKVMVYGATGAIGSAAIQILKQHTGATVTAVCNTKNLERIKALGPDRVIDYEKEDFTAGGEQYHFILDAVGKSSFGICKKLLLPGGKYMSSELAPGNQNLYLPLTTRFSKKRMVFPLPSDIKNSLSLMKGLLAAGKFSPLTDRSYPLEQIADAFAYVSSGRKTGNVLLRVKEK
ncbi:MAG TPA: NAD(P)-dependent alcohol dehydrogenase [Chitinophagaceae bacterium]|nr:NAD(P)-dependent alcohol dehydrogenase [Chitinophagaceae bacterium]